MLTDRVALCYTLASTFIFGALFGFINSAQQIYVGIYGLGVWFPVAFAGVAKYPARVKCALLGWTALTDALARAGQDISRAATAPREPSTPAEPTPAEPTGAKS